MSRVSYTSKSLGANTAKKMLTRGLLLTPWVAQILRGGQGKRIFSLQLNSEDHKRTNTKAQDRFPPIMKGDEGENWSGVYA